MDVMRSGRGRIGLGLISWLFVFGGCAGDGESDASPPGLVGDTITLGALTPLSDAVAVIGVPLAAGLQTYFEALNERGGVRGRLRVRLLIEDIAYVNPSSTVQKYQKIKDQIAMLAMVVGTDHINTLLPLLEEDSVVASPTTFDAEWVREPNLLPWGSPYQISTINGMGYYLTEGGGAGKRVCALALATGYGEAGIEGLQFASRELGFEIAATARFRQDDQDFVAPITQLRNARCDAVLLVSLPSVTGKVLGAAAQLSFEPRWIMLSPGWHGSLAESPLRDYYEKNLWVAFDGAEWGDSTVAGMRTMLAAQRKFRPTQQPDIFYVAGWVIGRSVHAALEKAASLSDLSRAGILRAVSEMGPVSFDGLMSGYQYGPAETREPPRSATIFRINAAKPVGLEPVAVNYTSPAALRYTFQKRER